MTIDQAISMLSSILKDRHPYEGGSGNDAIRLGIEALKRIKTLRADWRISAAAPLPDETED